jgi:hypothetical protein
MIASGTNTVVVILFRSEDLRNETSLVINTLYLALENVHVAPKKKTMEMFPER